MVCGATGSLGQLAVLHVVMESQKDQGLVTIQPPLMEGQDAVAQHQSSHNVKLEDALLVRIFLPLKL